MVSPCPTCPKWGVRLVDEDGNAMGGRDFDLKAPKVETGSLDGGGKTTLYEDGDPGSGAAIDILFPDLKILPNFDSMWSAYPAGPQPGVLSLVGGNLEAQALSYQALNPGALFNTCVIRMSRAFNYADKSIRYVGTRHIQREADPSISHDDGHAIPSGDIGFDFQRLAGADTLAYGTRVRELGPYLANFYPDSTKTPTSRRDLTPFNGWKGIMQMNIDWGDATGHFALWDGTAFRVSGDNYIMSRSVSDAQFRDAILYHTMEVVFLRKIPGATTIYEFQLRRLF